MGRFLGALTGFVLALFVLFTLISLAKILYDTVWA